MTKSSGEAPAIDGDAAMTLLEPLTDIVTQAGAAILSVARPSMKVEGKADGSLVTEADMAADRVIAEGLAKLVPHVPTLSEERTLLAKRPYKNSFFLIDPLDGTTEFVAGRDEFTVNLALVTNGKPLLGIVSAPALGLLWRGVVGHGAERVLVTKDARARAAQPIRTRKHPGSGGAWIVAVSRSHMDKHTQAFIAARPGAIRQVLGSAIKFCRVAEGGADIYPRLAPKSEWDVAAGHAVVTAAGGKITDGKGGELRFGEAREGFLVPEFIAWGDADAAGQ
ncbi:MAG: 3'(2'),5'-bisphosphate nucleotidase CysQ [Rhizobiales bacterium]|nr:3'(2'),5'-bisphosphate nucleotidase CysQ [Hyphomicrobiales bacterium]